MSEEPNLSGLETITERINRAIKVPDGIITEDGRDLRIVKWAPIVENGRVVKIEAQFVVLLDERIV